MSNFDLPSIPKTIDLRFALAATKSKVSASSLSKVRIGGELPVSTFALVSSMRSLSRRRLSRKTAKFSATVHVFWSLCTMSLSMLVSSCERASKSNAMGAFRVFHISSILRNRSMSSLNTLSKTSLGNSSEPIDSRIRFNA